MLGFETARLRMRPLDASDEALYMSLYTDADTMRYICAPLLPERALRSFRKAITQPRPQMGPFLFAMMEKATDSAVGICSAVQVDLGAARAEVGVMLKSDARGQGYAREGLSGVVQSAFQTHSVATIWVECSALNPVVERMVESVGFALEDEAAAGTGSLLQRTWSVRRSSWCP